MTDELLGPAPTGWKYVNLGDLQEHKGIQGGPFGSQLHAEDYEPSGIPLIMPKNIGENKLLEDGHDFVSKEDAERLSGHRVRLGDIVVGRKGDLSRRALIREQQQGWLCGTDCIRIRVAPDAASSIYLSYYLGLKAVGAWLHRHDTGSTLPSLNTGNLSRLPVLLAPRGQQVGIAAILGALDDKIAVNDRIAVTTESLLKAKFVHISQNANREVNLGDLVDFKYGKALREEVRTPGRIPVFGGNGVSGWHDSSLDEGPGIIVGRKGANAGSVSWSQGAFWPIDTAFYVKQVSSDIPLEFVFFLLENAGLRNLVGDSAIPGLNRDIALSCSVRLPDPDGIRVFAETAGPLLALGAQAAEESRSLSQLRGTLLPKLMSGEIRVRDAEKVVEDVT